MTVHITAEQILAGLLPAEATGVLFRESGLMLCREHLTEDNLEGLVAPGVVLWGLVECDDCSPRPPATPPLALVLDHGGIDDAARLVGGLEHLDDVIVSVCMTPLDRRADDAERFRARLPYMLAPIPGGPRLSIERMMHVTAAHRWTAQLLDDGALLDRLLAEHPYSDSLLVRVAETLDEA